jgi:hypothetical protein
MGLPPLDDPPMTASNSAGESSRNLALMLVMAAPASFDNPTFMVALLWLSFTQIDQLPSEVLVIPTEFSYRSTTDDN